MISYQEDWTETTILCLFLVREVWISKPIHQNQRKESSFSSKEILSLETMKGAWVKQLKMREAV